MFTFSLNSFFFFLNFQKALSEYLLFLPLPSHPFPSLLLPPPPSSLTICLSIILSHLLFHNLFNTFLSESLSKSCPHNYTSTIILPQFFIQNLSFTICALCRRKTTLGHQMSNCIAKNGIVYHDAVQYSQSINKSGKGPKI